jgi:hypothetical protein
VGPIFFIESSNPQKLISIWKQSVAGVESSDKYEATVVEFSPERVQAIEKDSFGLYIYTIFLKSGVVFYNHHRYQSLLDPGPTLLSFVGQCSVRASPP